MLYFSEGLFYAAVKIADSTDSYTTDASMCNTQQMLPSASIYSRPKNLS